MEYYKNESGEIAVLVSGGYGAGWSTWDASGLDLATDKRIVEKFLEYSEKPEIMRAFSSFGNNETKEEFKNFLKGIGYDGVYLGGFPDIHIEWVEEGTPIRITEYDGFERLEDGYCGYTTL